MTGAIEDSNKRRRILSIQPSTDEAITGANSLSFAGHCGMPLGALLSVARHWG